MTLEVPFAAARYSEAGHVGRFELEMRQGPASDEALEEILAKLAEIFGNLAQRPEMILFIRIDGRLGAVPSLRQLIRVRTALAALGPDLLLVGRGSSIVVRSNGKGGPIRRASARALQKALLVPWPKSTASSVEEADAFLTHLEAECLGTEADAAPTVPSAGATPIALSSYVPQEPAVKTLLQPVGDFEAEGSNGKVSYDVAGNGKVVGVAPAVPDVELEKAAQAMAGDEVNSVLAKILTTGSFSDLDTPRMPDEDRGGSPIWSWSRGPWSPSGPAGSLGRKDKLLLDTWRRKLEARVRPLEDLSPPAELPPGFADLGSDMEVVQAAPGGFLFCGCHCVKVEPGMPLT